MADLSNFKGELQTFCSHHLCSPPQYNTEQLLSTEWRSECSVELPNKVITESLNKTDKQRVTTTATKLSKKKEVEAAAAKAMLDKLKNILAPHLSNIRLIKHTIHLNKSKIKKELLDILESLFTDQNINDSMFMRQLMQKNPDQWIALEDVINLPMLRDELGQNQWNNDQYIELRQWIVRMIENNSKTLELSSDKEFIRSKNIMNNICTKNQIKSEELKLIGNQAFAEKKYQDAIKHYLEAMKYDQSDYKISMNLSLSYLKQKDHENALKFADKAIQQKPTYAKPYARAAVVLFAMDKLQDAIATMNRAIRNTNSNQQYTKLQKEWQKTLNES